ncbi:hypothetical protein CLAFUW4_11131 [Fulvia fulva]|uniref:FAD/NAD(P)-binding domain-containing protein n=1 Tax=Passalora fulva TaxID=5499 RepID=A0A9Q8PD04_PASFU|nr:uncharacterized protein CLAFUR5_10180 [Fulvia fulva]KAK4620166.1 hypothetical protein CLAFUR4_11136 [Fulvia fulva]KAK4620733.1 hypothetical protein CLAFUR0_11141 [Fulvia fulva]UJO20175.1 hypothetical protein CLAFUR5_10180 [Fulvia fulva]WPV17737.1 hypothetical protein CLAFUW4_11131 [Fulvia fulva]WPV32717.1 hypothetical protein CLAFUW7_11127 [Fulvia fulva]
MAHLQYDLIVVGAGIYALQALRTYLDIHPAVNVFALEADDGAGRVWSEKRFYHDFWTQLSFGCCDFSDRPMKRPAEEDLRYGLFDAKYVPPNDRSIAFVGFISLVNNFLGAEWQALWATAWLDHSPLLQIPSPLHMKRRIAYDTQWSRRRYPYSSEISGTTYDLECIPYGDWLMAELGLTSHVRGLSWWQYWTSVNCQSRYAGLVPEYKDKLVASGKTCNLATGYFQNEAVQ